ncbi:MAG: (2Fe-2S)-binding protein [Hydrogenophaga sp.]|uniref:(2Fe-2S)-binding protein n=1 Tax=Hydrogenophaga sp. TaxID=1904254 RepID=UPI0026098BEF|nr:(2Fe-2S)-binding protein [Hydrogenophaga sp.]MCV0438481.1 (2Fe-2S)-binding protein [Hydrogenophaga sp.]
MNPPVLEREALHTVRLNLNGRERTGQARPRLLLSDFLRHELGATGTHVGCEHGVCGACTVRIDGVAARACLTLAVQVDGRHVDTVENPAGNDAVLDALKAAFKRHHALQCGFCTSGILMSSADWLQRQRASGHQPDEAEVRDMLSGHLCRCTGYTPIVNAVMEVSRA